MNKYLQKWIAKRIWQYPSIFKTGGDVARQVLLSGGTGYFWNEHGNIGYLKYPYVDKLKSFILFFDTFPNIHLVKEYKKHDPKYYEQQLEWYYSYYNFLINIRRSCYVRASIEKLSSIDFDVNDVPNKKLCSYGYLDENSLLANVPENVKPKWQEFIEIALWITETYPEYYEQHHGKGYYIKDWEIKND